MTAALTCSVSEPRVQMMAAGEPPLPVSPATRRRARALLECPICLALLSEPAVSRCGHSFCAACIQQYSRRVAAGSATPCPVCETALGDSGLYPNAALTTLVERARARGEGPGGMAERIDIKTMSEAEADRLLQELLMRKARQRANRQSLGNAIMIKFLEACRKEKHSALKSVNDDLALLDSDLDELQRRRIQMEDSMVSTEKDETRAAAEAGVVPSDVHARNLLISRYRENVESTYFQMRRTKGDQALSDITDMLIDATSISTVSRRSGVQHIDILRSDHNLISSIEFNASATLFATAGVTKRIKVFDFNNMLESHSETSTQSSNQHHYPVLEIPTVSKLSCLSWSHQRKSVIAASTYKGDIILHDTETNTQLQSLKEHTKRTWYVDFSVLTPNLLLSGSDDHTVKLWDVERQAESAMTLQTSANVCCVKFNPHESHELAFGSADHNVYSYDLRHPRTPLCVFEGHWRAVSHVLFLNRAELVSASTDSSCKLWNVQRQEPGLSYAGHTNDRNFVGLAGWRDFFACGSEDNSVYVYHKGFSGPVVRYGFGSRAGFVSTVAWKPNSNLLVAANNTGGVEILQLH